MIRLSWRFIVIVSLLAASLALVEWNQDRRTIPLARPLLSVPAELAGWHGRSGPPITAEVLEVLQPTSHLSRSYWKDRRQVDVLVAYYERQRAGESMHSPKHCLPGTGWEILEAGAVDLPGGGPAARINKFTVHNGSTTLIVLYWYQTRQRVIANEYWGKVCLVWDAIVHADSAGTIVRLTFSDQPGALDAGLGLAGGMMRALQVCFGPPDEGRSAVGGPSAHAPSAIVAAESGP